MNIKLIVSDIDGTLINKNNELTCRTLNVLKEAANKGIYIVIASGRTKATMQGLIDKLPMVHYTIESNGAVIREVRTNKIVEKNFISTQLSIEAFNAINKYNVIYHCFINSNVYIKKDLLFRYKSLFKDKSTGIFLLAKPVTDLDMLVMENQWQVEKINVLSLNMYQKNQIRKEFENIGGLSITESLIDNLEINNSSVSKGNALSLLAKKLNIHPEEIVAFGDNENDISMFETAGLGFAMANSSSKLLKVAKYKTLTNEEDGVAHILENYILNRNCSKEHYKIG